MQLPRRFSLDQFSRLLPLLGVSILYSRPVDIFLSRDFSSDPVPVESTWRCLVSTATAANAANAANAATANCDTDGHTEKIRTPATDLFKINHPVLLAGMNVAAGPKLAAAVTNAGGLGVLGGINYTPDMLRDQIDELKSHLNDKNAPFGVDLLLPQIGGSARKTK